MNTENENSNLLSQKPQIPQKPSTVPYRALFRYATRSDELLITIGVITSVLNGAAQPLFAVIFGRMTDAFTSQDPDEILVASGQSALYFVYLAAGSFVLSFLMFASLIISGEKQSIQLRKEYFKAILSQEVGWFDSINPNELNTKVADQTHDVQGAIQEKLGTFILTFATFIGGLVVGYSTGWQLALVITACMPALALSVIVITATVMKSMQATQESYSIAAAESEQALNAIKTVKMLDGEDFECQKYSSLLQNAARITIKYSLINGAALGMIFAFMIWTYALGFFYGAKLISDQTINDNNGKVYTAGDVMTIFFAILMGSFSLGQAGPCFQNFGKGQVAGAQIFQIIDRVPRILSPVNPKKLDNFDGEITLEEVEFTYPARPDVQVLKKTSLTIPAGQKVALVGESGCGKSTVLQLVERFYDVDAGAILIGKDKINIRDLDLNHYRSLVGLVGQEPVLFATSIRENLLYGKTDASEEEMIDALKKVNAWDFVSKMDKGLDTYVGIGGGQLSGGQKQRIAIARAILKKPKVLLLDEATSALDRTNEKLIQSTLDEVSKGITTIVIAHRLSTIQNSDLIYVFAEGRIVEQGTHNQLMNLGGKYMALAKNQITQHHDQQKGHDSLNQINQNQIIVKELGNPQNEDLLESVQSVNQLEPGNVIEKAVNNLNDLKILQKAVTLADVSDRQSDELTQGQIFARLFAYNRAERPYFILGLLSATINGCIFPCFSMFFSEIIALLVRSNPILYANDFDKIAKQNEVYDEAILICLWFFLFGLGFLIFQACESFLLSIVAENLSVKLRTDSFRKLLRMPIPYFDKPENNAGTLTARLSVDCKIVQALTSTIIGFKVQNVASLSSGMAIAFSASWALTLIVLGIAPITYWGRKMRTKFMGGFNQRTDLAYKDSGNLIMEAVTNIRTVFSFGNQAIIHDAYCRKVQGPIEECTKNGILAGLGFGFSQMQTYLINGFIFYMGAVLVKYQGLELENMFKAIFGITFATIGGSRDAHFVGDVDKGQAAARNIFKILDSIDEYQIERQTKFKMLTTPISGNIELKSIAFKYPGRDKNVFEQMSLVIPAGQKVSFVGPSGCGKSTIMQMLMRFYDPDDGMILIDGINIKDYSIRHLRRQLAIVSQEPTLFNGTIAENIRYNNPHCSMEEIEEAAKKANAYHFIVNDITEVTEQKSDMGKGFDKKVGPKGQQISGGQKQRIAIARAILRNASILLLDEATSALDAQAEELVQESLNSFMREKTTLTIAHRISTIKESDIIYVFEGGKIVEQGKYDELVAQKQYFYRLEQGIAHERKQQQNTK